MKVIADFLLSAKEGSVKKDVSLLTLVFGIAFFQYLGRIPLIEPDEGRYAEIPREMLELGDFITPHLNYVKYFEKPPLHYWLNALSFTIFGQNEFAARFPGALMGLLTVLLTYIAGRRLFGRREGLLAALILGTSIGFLAQARIDFTDMTLTCTLTAALVFFIQAVQGDEQHKCLYYHLFYIFAALAVLSKGLIGLVFPGGIIFLYFFFTRRWHLLREMRLVTGIPLFLLISAPWFIMVSLKNSEFPGFFFIHEHFERFTTTVHHHKKGFWYFVPVLIGTMFPWSFFIPAVFLEVWRERRTDEGNCRFFLLIWSTFIFLFFSISSSQLIPYILPVFPSLALLMGSIYAPITGSISTTLKFEGYSIAGVLIVGGLGIICYPYIASHPAFSALGCAVIGSILLFEGILTLKNIVRGSPYNLFICLIISSYIVGIAAPHIVLAGIAERRNLKELGLAVREKAGKDAVVASFGLQQGLSFYTRRRVVIVGERGETTFGSKQGDYSGWFIDLQRFTQIWDSRVQVFVLLSEGEYRSLLGYVRVTPRVVAQTTKKLIITNH